MTLGPIPIILKKTPEGNTLGNAAEDNASAQVNQDKAGKKEASRIQSPFLKEQKSQDTKKQLITNKATAEDLNSFSVENTNAKFPNIQVVNAKNDNPGLSQVGATSNSNKDSDDDVGGTTFKTNKTVSENKVAQEFLEEITAKPNPFQTFASMTYGISLYMLGKEEYNVMMSTGKKSVRGLQLLLQSGGISANSTGNFGAKRSSNFFQKDFYIDDVELQGLVSGTSVGSAHNTFEINFTITEPNGLTFLEQLHGVVQEYNLAKGVNKDRINYAAQNYLMVVRFYGYDKYGNQITGKDIDVSETLSDDNAVMEKFIPFLFKGINFTIQNNVVTYQCKAVCPQTQIPFSVASATVPSNIELQGRTVQEVLSNGQAITEDEEEANEVGGFVGYNVSLAEALNFEQRNLVKQGTYEHANVYKIEFEKDSGINTARVVTTASATDKDRSSMALIQDKQRALLTDKGWYDKNSKTFSIQAGQSVVQVIDLILRTSSYISNQQNIVFDEKTGKVSKKEKAPEVLQWYKIRTKLKILEYDNKRGDFAYEVTYVISRYQINNLRSPYYGPSKFRGVHKEFNYWFTGENTEVLDFSQSFNYLYYQTMGGDVGVPKLHNNAREIQKRYYQRNSSESNQGGKNRVAEGAANAASILYSPADTAQVEMSIVGDPDWIAQSEIFYGNDPNDLNLGPFMTDGSVNYDSSEVLFAVNYNTPVDYDLSTGLADTGKKNVGRDLKSGAPGLSQLSLIYRANQIITRLNNGMFTQTLKGTQLMFPTEEQEQVEKDELDILLEQAEHDQKMMESGLIYDPESDMWLFEQELENDVEQSNGNLSNPSSNNGSSSEFSRTDDDVDA